MDHVYAPRAAVALVDDDPAVRQALSFALETAGVAVAAFADAESALAAPDRLFWRCVVLDQRLPGMSGVDLLEHLRAAGSSAACVLITTHPSGEVRRRAKAAGAEIMEKPLLDNRLTQSVLHWVGLHAE
ncbi:MAG: response regulator [Hyphomonadaceae bacterium]